MATLTNPEKDQMRQEFAAANAGGDIPWTKPQINAAGQAIEDVLTSPQVQTAISNAIDAAMTPIVLSATAKRRLVAILLRLKFQRDQV